MIAALAVEPLTHADLISLPADEHIREIINGALFVSPPPSLEHQGVLLNLTRIFSNACEAADFVGVVRFAPAPVKFNPYCVVEPDLIFVRRERWEEIYRDGVIMGAPDIVVEVIAPGSRSHDRVTKFGLYAGNGVPEYWLVDPVAREVAMHTLVMGVYEPVTPNRDGALVSRVLPGVTVDPAGCFAPRRAASQVTSPPRPAEVVSSGPVH